MKDLARNVMVDFVQMKRFVEDPLILSSGEGIRVVDVDGRRYIDGLSGTFCANLGHGNKALADAGSEQLYKLAMACPTLATNDRALELSEVLLGLLPKQYTTVKLLSGGSEVTEAAIKMARQYHKQRVFELQSYDHDDDHAENTLNHDLIGGVECARVEFDALT